jgi:hypothetical protein
MPPVGPHKEESKNISYKKYKDLCFAFKPPLGPRVGHKGVLKDPVPPVAPPTRGSTFYESHNSSIAVDPPSGESLKLYNLFLLFVGSNLSVC